ncbi:5-oxoprolinase subunit B family protein [Pseudidiomarina sp. WS423]|uniref:5-oxoprolinase subunit B family protein n=1 Tax=Pseudidiomarina sp. WS423 TaxID=3425124 RepID=UPI003D6E9F72
MTARLSDSLQPLAQVEIAAADALLVRFANRIDRKINAQVLALRDVLQQRQQSGQWPWLLELAPAYHSLLVQLDIRHILPDAAQHQLQQLLAQPALVLQLQAATPASKPDTIHQIDVCYHPEFAADLQAIASAANLSVAEVIALHTQPTYHVYALGFAPQFAYLGDVPEPLRMPRLATPRQQVPAGSVAIANQQTAIYPRTSPGGWQLIGRAVSWPQLQAGDQVRFRSISLSHYQQAAAAIHSASARE